MSETHTQHILCFFCRNVRCGYCLSSTQCNDNDDNDNDDGADDDIKNTKYGPARLGRSLNPHAIRVGTAASIIKPSTRQMSAWITPWRIV